MLFFEVEKRNIVRSGIGTHAWRTRLRPERSALDCLVILTFTEVEFERLSSILYCCILRLKNDIMSGVGFESKPGEPDCDLNGAP